MKKVVILRLLFLTLIGMFLFSFVSGELLEVSLTITSGEWGQTSILNFTFNNTGIPAEVNLTQINITVPLEFDIGTTTGASGLSGPSIFGDGSNNINISNLSFGGILHSGEVAYFWFDVTNPLEVGYFDVTVVSLDTLSEINLSIITLNISDTIIPSISFVSPTPADGSNLNYTYIQLNVSANDSGSGLKNITLYFYNSTSLITSTNATSSYLFYNITSLSEGVYYVNATAFDNAGNFVSASTRDITIDTTVPCTAMWTCEWGECVNGTQSQVNCVDANSCNTTAPSASQVCESCVSSWDCGDWIPASCSGSQNQTRLCTDLNYCAAPDTQTRTCVTSSGSTTSGTEQPALSPTILFFIIIGVIVASVLGVFLVLMRIKKKSASGGDSGSDYPVYTPPRPPSPPPALPPPGYARPPVAYPPNQPVYPNQPQNY